MRPHVKMTGAAFGSGATGRVGMAAPWAMVSTLVASTSNPSHSRFRAASVITTTRSANAATSFSTER